MVKVFTDDDLKLLKDKFPRFSLQVLGTKGRDSDYHINLDALLARLEAAEAILSCIYREGTEEYNELLELWRKAAGK